MVREAGLEPACLSTGDFKSPVYTIPPLSLSMVTIKNNITPYGMERISEWSSILLISHCPRFYQRSKMALFLMSLCVHRRYPSMLFLMVPQERLELSRLATLASKTSVSTIPPPGQISSLIFNEQSILYCHSF